MCANQRNGPLGDLHYCLPSFDKPINLATTGAGGMDTGTAPVSGLVALYAIYLDYTDGRAAGDECDERKAAKHLRRRKHAERFTASALVSVWPTDSSSHFVIANKVDRHILTFPNQLLTTSSQATSLTSLSIAGAVPLNAVSADVNALECRLCCSARVSEVQHRHQPATQSPSPNGRKY